LFGAEIKMAVTAKIDWQGQTTGQINKLKWRVIATVRAG
jgi:hypothetical protein